MKYKIIKFTLLFSFFILNLNIIITYASPSDTMYLSELNDDLDMLLNTKISVASKYEQKVSEAPGSISIITSEDIERWGFRTLSEALMSIKGFFHRNDRMYEYIGLRGFERPNSYNNKILLLIDGHILNDNIYNSPFFENDLALNMYSIERIEVVRGPGSALYGTSAMTAVINVITKNAIALDEFRISGALGSYGTKEGLFQVGKQIFDDFNIVLSAKYGYQDGEDLYFKEYDSVNNGIAVGLDWQKYYSLFADINYKDWTLTGFYNHRQKAIPTATWEMEFNKPTPYGTDERGFLELKYSKEITSAFKFFTKVYFDVYKYFGEYTYVDTNNDSNLGLWAGTELQAIWDLSLNNRLTIGSEYKYNFQADYRFWVKDSVIFDNNYPFYSFSLYIQDHWQLLQNLSLTLGLRLDQYSRFEGSISPRMAINYYPWTNTTLKFLYGEAFRVPNIFEMYYTDYITQKANDKLVPEKINTFEFILEQKINKYLYGSLSIYYYKMNNLIDQANVIETDSLGQIIEEYIQFQNIGTVDAYGFEFELNSKFPFGLWGYFSYSYQYLKDLAKSEKLTNFPVHILKLGLSQRLFKCIFIGAEFLWESERLDAYGTYTNSYSLANTFISIKPSIKNEDGSESFLNRLNVSLKLNNIFDTKYSLPAALDFKQHSIPQNGFNLMFEASVNF